MLNITNKIITGFEYDPTRPQFKRFGFAKQKELGFCYVKKTGEPIPSAPMGEEKYMQLCRESKRLVEPFLAHLRRLFTKDPRDLDIFLDYMAFKQQYPTRKIRWAIVLAGDQGVGKDLSIDACWNAFGIECVKNISPSDCMGQFNEFLNKALLLRISEAADLGESNRFDFNNKIKVMIAGNPDTVRINPKYGICYWLKMCHGTIITTNHLNNGFYIPENDRRYYVIKCASWAEIGLEEGEERSNYFSNLRTWFTTTDPETGLNGYEKVGAYLFHYRNVENFPCDNCPRSTAAKKEAMENSNSAPQWMIDCVDNYSDCLSKIIPENVSSALYQVKDDMPLILRFRGLRSFIDTYVKNAITDKSALSRINPKRIAFLLSDLGFEKVDSGRARGCWRFSGTTLQEHFYYNSRKISENDARKEVEEYGADFCQRFDDYNKGIF